MGRITWTSVDYWLNKGYSEEEAKSIISKKQREISLRNRHKIEQTFTIGDTFGWWKVESLEFKNGEELGKTKPTGVYVHVKCKCGFEEWVASNVLRRDRSKGCRGCYHRGSKNNRWSGYKDMPGTVFHKVRSSAKGRCIKLLVSIEYLRNLMHDQEFRCTYSGEELSWDSCSLDRIDSDLGYVEGNVQWVLPEVNYMKHTLVESRFLDLCRKIEMRDIE